MLSCFAAKSLQNKGGLWLREIAIIESQVTVTARTRARENPKCYRLLYETAARSAAKICYRPLYETAARGAAKICYRTLCERSVRNLSEKITCIECGKPHI